jgi:hypothetical protein
MMEAATSAPCRPSPGAPGMPGRWGFSLKTLKTLKTLGGKAPPAALLLEFSYQWSAAQPGAYP